MRPRTDHTCQVHEPGARACYGTHSCRCRACTDAATRWQRHFNHAKTTGRKLTVDAAPIAQHVARLLAAGDPDAQTDSAAPNEEESCS